MQKPIRSIVSSSATRRSACVAARALLVSLALPQASRRRLRTCQKNKRARPSMTGLVEAGFGLEAERSHVLVDVVGIEDERRSEDHDAVAADRVGLVVV